MLEKMIDKLCKVGTNPLLNNPLVSQARELIGLGEAPIYVNPDLLERLKYVIARDLVKNGPLETLLSDEQLEDIHSED